MTRPPHDDDARLQELVDANRCLGEDNALMAQILSTQRTANIRVDMFEVLESRCDRTGDVMSVELLVCQLNGARCRIFAHYREPGLTSGELLMVTVPA